MEVDLSVVDALCERLHTELGLDLRAGVSPPFSVIHALLRAWLHSPLDHPTQEQQQVSPSPPLCIHACIFMCVCVLVRECLFPPPVCVCWCVSFSIYVRTPPPALPMLKGWTDAASFSAACVTPPFCACMPVCVYVNGCGYRSSFTSSILLWV